MSVNNELFGNLHPRRVIEGEIWVEGSNSNGHKPIKMELFVGPSGGLFARPVAPVPIDQQGAKEVTPVNRRHQGCDQL